MKKNISISVLFLFVILFQNISGYAQSKIKAYFNTPVDNTLSTGVNAVYLPTSMADTIVAYINRAQYSIDIAQYDYTQDTYNGAYANIATAVNNAYLRGVTVRWIADGAAPNTGLAGLNPGIHTLSSPTTSAYGIMHNKFIVIDANSSNPNDAIVSTGSEDWSSEMFYKDYNNVLFIQDSALAHAFTAEFNMMWGSTTATPNSSLSKFGPYKTDLGRHTFTIAGHTVELYFSPSDGTDAHVASTILTADKDLYVGVYDMTRTGDANDIVTRRRAGVYTLAILDQYSTTPAPAPVNTILSGGLGTNYAVYHGRYLFHNKLMIVDPSDTCSDPAVLTGSYNWTTSGTSYNDENILIIHNDTLANIYYQSYIPNFLSISGQPVTPANYVCGATMTEMVNTINNTGNLGLYPNPAFNELTISSSSIIKSVTICNITGQTVFSSQYSSEIVQVTVAGFPAGVYFVKVNGTGMQKFIKN